MVTRVESMSHSQQGSSAHTPVTPKEVIHVATVNVRYNNGTTSDGPIFDIPYREKPWSERKTRLVDCLLSTGDLDIIGFQEVLHDQLLDLQHLLGPVYGHVGVGRDDGKQAGEYSPIFYDKMKFDLVDWSTIWLSTTPDIPSKGWDAALPRIATLLTLRRKDKKGCLVHAVNTHYDHLGLRARAESSLLIRSQIWQWVKRIEEREKVEVEGPVILFGDFNSPPSEGGYRNITSPHPLPSGQSSFYFLDSYTHLSPSSTTPQTRPYGPELTYTDFAPPGSRDATRIDFVMLGAEPASDKEYNVKGRGEWEVDRYACLDNFVDGDVKGWKGRWSDHRAVRVTIVHVG
ncbi:uncharacterized protein IL334_002675 [Kwoniella shivajii]|uniref:Endonuclease/exonuclease/phosphatase domain-containing protein n=1 Tax=Kwoniella shivajii TaxID=564305 RepID=A0ABZ1CZK2_9TREE|nr:hypothetical protein IL334_002675 [Kwoniella shivajii]